jgi:hypothetical protein
MNFDLIIVSKSENSRLRQITQNCIDSARQDCELNVILIETSGSRVEYHLVNTYVQYEGPFNYNHALNEGLQFANRDIHILANNDLIFHKGWSKIGEVMTDYGFDSASVLSNDRRQKGFKRGEYIYEGYNVGSLLTGWLIFVTKNCIAKIGKLGEEHEFWYSDNIYADQLKRAGIKHILYCGAQVDHLESATLRTLSYKEQKRLMKPDYVY